VCEEAFESIFLGRGAGGTPYHAERSRAGVLRYFQSGFVPGCFVAARQGDPGPFSVHA
jgi:hypothetical protein